MKLIFPAQLVTHTKFRPRLHEAPGIHAFGGQEWWRDGDGGFLTQYNAKGIMRLLSDAFQNDILYVSNKITANQNTIFLYRVHHFRILNNLSTLAEDPINLQPDDR